MVTLHDEKTERVRSMSSFFYFRRSDRRLIWVLGVLVLFCLGVWTGSKMNGSKETEDTLSASVADSLQTAVAGTSSEGSSVSNEVRPQVFNPNSVDSLTLVACGLETWKVHTFLRYRAAGKQFYSEADLLDTYGWQADDIKKLRPYLRFGEQPSAATLTVPSYTRPHAQTATSAQAKETNATPHRDKFDTHTLVDLNTADTTLLQRIPGIGPYYASQIVRMRERLGGYIDVEQLREIRNFPDESIDWFQVSNPKQIRRVSLSDDIPSLGRHPYIGYSRARALHQYQHLYGTIKDSTTLAATRIFSHAELQQLLPYIQF